MSRSCSAGRNPAKHEWYSDRKQSTIWEFDKPKKNADHPTMKPVAMLAYAILNSSMSNCIVLDPFGGSGSTLIACEQTGRVCDMIELDEKYCDVIVKRYIEQVGNADSVYLIRDGKAVLEAVVSVVRPDAEVPAPAGDRWPYADIYMGDGWSVAYRTFDAQYWGVPQRRRRVYLIADLTGGSAGEILFKSEGLSGYSPESFRAWQRAARSPQNSSGSASLCLNDQSGSRMDVTEDMTATLRAEAHHPPCIMEAAGFCTEHSSKARSVGYEAETSPTLRAGVVPAAIALENHPHRRQTEDRIPQCRSNSDFPYGDRRYEHAACYGYAQNAENTFRLQRRWQGALLFKKTCPPRSPATMTKTLFEPRVYGICSDKSNSMLSDNPRSGIYEAGSSRTIDANGGNPGCNQGGMAVVETAPAYSASKSSFFTTAEKELAGTLVATDYKDPPLVNDGSGMEFVVRRLTPTECARLQGFPDWWCEGLGMENPTDEEIAFWTEVWETHRKIVGTTDKPKSHKQIVKWLRDPHSDSAEYKMWGNGVALPCVYFVLSGIVWSAQSKAE
jgi:DNA (cytosine-5)-methyltransferase 1